MNSEWNLNERMPEYSDAGKIKTDLSAAKVQPELLSLFICAFAALAAAMLFALVLAATPVTPVQSASNSPVMLDGEMAVIYRLEQAQIDPQTTTPVWFDLTRLTQIEWLQILVSLKLELNKALAQIKLQRSVSQGYKALFKAKYSGLI